MRERLAKDECGKMITWIMAAMVLLITALPGPAQRSEVVRSTAVPWEELPQNEQIVVFGVAPYNYGQEGGWWWGLNQPTLEQPAVTPPKESTCRDMCIFAAPGEYEPGSLAIWPTKDLQGVTLEVSALRCATNTIPSSTVDIRVVKWAYVTVPDHTGGDLVKNWVYVPLLLLRDDELLTSVHFGSRYSVGYNVLKYARHDMHDSSALLPVDLVAQELKQFWLTVHVPEDAVPGIYEGTVTIKAANVSSISLPLKVQVLPFRLSESRWFCWLYYAGGYKDAYLREEKPELRERVRNESPSVYQHWMNGGRTFVHPFYKTDEQIIADIRDMAAHGVGNVGWYCPPERAVRLMKQTGFGNGHTYVSVVQAYANEESVAYLRAAGYDDIYIMLQDEPKMADLDRVRQDCEQRHSLGVKAWTALSVIVPASEYLLDWIDLPNLFGEAYGDEEARTEVAKWHQAGKRVMTYGYFPWAARSALQFRLHYGLHLWRRGFDGSCDFAYQWRFAANSWDFLEARSLAWTVPVSKGEPVPTIKWETMREAKDDLRYLSTLLDCLEAAKKTNPDAVAIKQAENWLADLKERDQLISETESIQDIRAQMVKHIVAFSEKQ